MRWRPALIGFTLGLTSCVSTVYNDDFSVRPETPIDLAEHIEDYGVPPCPDTENMEFLQHRLVRGIHHYVIQAYEGVAETQSSEEGIDLMQQGIYDMDEETFCRGAYLFLELHEENN